MALRTSGSSRLAARAALIHPTTWAALGALLLGFAVAAFAAGETTRASVSSTGEQANGQSMLQPAFSADGRYVVFASLASNLVPGDTNENTDIFVHDRQTGQTVRANVSSLGGQTARDINQVLNYASIYPSISADGRFVSFSSSADGLVGGDWDNYSHVYVHDMVTGTTVRADVSTNGETANNVSGTFISSSTLSADGRFIAFQSAASNLVPGDTNNTFDIFVRDLQLGTTERVNLSNQGEQATPAEYSYVSISGDGRYVAFHAVAVNPINLVPNAPLGHHVYVRDRQLGITTLVSVDAAGQPMNGGTGSGYAYFPQISQNGRFVVFRSDYGSEVPNAGGPGIFVRDLQAGTTTRANILNDGSSPTPTDWPAISADGRFVVWGDSVRVWVRDMVSGTTQLASVSLSGGIPNSFGGHPTISADGRSVAFTSGATDLVPNDTNAQPDVFVRDISDVDFVPPSLSNAAASPVTVVNTGGDVTLSLDSVDAVGTTNVTAVVSGPGVNNPSVTLSLVSGTAQNGTWRGTLAIPANETPNVRGYAVAFVAADAAGNPAKASAGFSVAETPQDLQVPVVTQPGVAPSSLPAAGGTVTITATVSDNVGVGQVQASIEKPGGQFDVLTLDRVSGDARSGGYRIAYPVPANAGEEALTYRVEILATDTSGLRGRSSSRIPFTVAAPETGPRITLTPLNLNFGTVRVGTRPRKIVRVKNTGSGSLTGSIGRLAAPFSVVSAGGSYRLGPGEERKVTVQFAPARRQSQPFTAKLKITSNDPDQRTTLVPVSGRSR